MGNAKDANKKYREIQGELTAAGLRFALVVSRFNAFVTERLLDGALDALHRSGAAASGIDVVRVPGAFEIPVTARHLAETGRYVDLRHSHVVRRSDGREPGAGRGPRRVEVRQQGV